MAATAPAGPLGEVLAFDDTALGERHDFIHWLFPLPEASQAVAGAPGLTSTTRGPPFTLTALERENAYLRARNAQMADDIMSLQAEARRLGEIVDRLHGRKQAGPPNPLSGGQ